MRQFRQLGSFIIYNPLLFAPLASAVCYYPNGYSEPSLEYQPCVNYSGETSMCCALNRTNPSGANSKSGFAADKCLENGLCQNVWTATDQNGTTVKHVVYVRDSCTSPDWTTGGCLDVCTAQTNPGIGSSSSIAYITPCDGTANSTTWCCGSNATCCDTSHAVTIAEIFDPTSSTTTASSTSSFSSSSAISKATTTSSETSPPASSSPSSSSSATPSSSSGLSSDAQAGIGLGVSLGGIALVIGAVFFLRRRWTGRNNEEQTLPTISMEAQVSSPPPDYLKMRQEVSPGIELQEMGSTIGLTELPGESATGTSH